MDKGHWNYIGDFEPDEWFGFIYRIIDNTNGREYIGKKQFHRYLKKRVTGKKNRISVVKSSDWKTYVSSSKHVQEAIKEKGKENFSFIIESLHETKASLYYEEVRVQVLEDVLRETLSSGERKYYNAQIANVKFLPKEATPRELEHKISKTTTLIRENTNHHYWKKLPPSEKKIWKKKIEK